MLGLLVATPVVANSAAAATAAIINIAFCLFMVILYQINYKMELVICKFFSTIGDHIPVSSVQLTE
jgi:hypothetical protein